MTEETKTPVSIQIHLFLKNKDIGYAFRRDRFPKQHLFPYISKGYVGICGRKHYCVQKKIEPITKCAKVYEYVLKHESFTIHDIAHSVGCHRNTALGCVKRCFRIEEIPCHKRYKRVYV